MRKTVLTWLLLAATLPILAQEGVITTHPAGPSGGKVLTMEETILSRAIHPAALPREAMQTLEQRGISFTQPAGLRAFTRDKSLYYRDAQGNDIPVAISENDQITYGESVSRNEFGINGGIFWSPDESKLAFYRKDESLVTEFPLLDITSRTGSLVQIKYPMNGMTSEIISLGVYDLKTRSTIYVQAIDFGYDRYLTNISWSPDSRYIFIQMLDRSQKHVRLNMYRSSDGAFVRTILTEDSDKYVEPSDPLYFIKGTYDFIYTTSNRDGFANLYLCDTLGTVKRLTAVDADVQYLANDGKSVYYYSREVSPAERHLFRIDLPTAKKGRKAAFGAPVRLTPDEGYHSVRLSSDFKWFIDSWSSFNVPGCAALRSTDGKSSEVLHTAADPLQDYATGEMVFGTVRSADGKYDNFYRLLKPRDFDPSKKYPVVVYVYGGPHSQMVNDSWLGQIRLWEAYMAQRGYVVYVQDNRGTSYQGLEYEQAIHRQCGVAEMEDQMVGIQMLKSLPWVDADRIGVHGWSYGGFMTISLITNHPDVFKVGVAGGPVIDWKWYEVMYGERYMETEETNPEGFARTSLINKAKDLKGKLLICQGAIDNTVVWEHSLSFISECISNNVQVDYFPYPTAEHNVAGKDRVHLMDKVTMYFDDYL